MQKYQEYEKAAEPAPEPDSCNDAAKVRNTEEVSHVEQRPDRPSEITYPAALESAYPRTHKTRRQQSPRKGAIMVAIRKTKAKEEFGPDPSLDLPQGAHLKITSSKLFAPEFHDETGDLWRSKVSLKLKVVDDRTEDGNADGLEFFDSYELKFDEDVAKKFGIGPEEDAKDKDGKKLTLEKFLNNANKSDFTEEQQVALLEQANWTVRTGIKLDNLLSVLYGEAWINGEMDFDPDDLVDKEFIAKVHPKTGKKPGSYTGWETYMSINPPKKRRNPRSKRPRKRLLKWLPPRPQKRWPRTLRRRSGLRLKRL
jgi:hypothetical protein